MYAEYYGLRELPFNNTPDPRFFYSTPDHEEALASLIYAVKERKGFVLLTGEVGAGKTLVSRMMLRHFGTSVSFANINHAVSTTGDLMESLCSEFELAYEPGTSNAQLVRTLHDYLLSKFAQNIPVVLVLDEAQNLPIEAFEQLRMIGNLEADDAKLLQIAIVGQPELQRLFQSPQLRQLKQRIFRSYHLPALDRKSTEGYIRYRLSVAAAKDVAIFSGAAIDRIYAVSGGLPRIINTICDNAMLSGYSADHRKIQADFLESVLGQMMLAGEVRAPRPAPMSVAPVSFQTPGVTGFAAPASTDSSCAPVSHRVLPSSMKVEGQTVAKVTSAATKSEAVIHAAAAEARALRSALETVSGQAKALIGRGENIVQNLQHREQRLEALCKVVSKAAGGLSDLLNRIEKASVQGRRDLVAAQQAHGHLATQTQRALQLADDLERRKLRFAAPPPSDRPSAAPPKTAPVAVAAVPKTRPVETVSVGPAGLGQMLSKTRDSLFDLRQLVRSAKNGNGMAIAADAQPQATTRLAHQVESLLDMVDSRTG